MNDPRGWSTKSIEDAAAEMHVRMYDEHGFKRLNYMTVEEKLDEILTHMRTTAITLKSFVESAENNPMLKPFLPKKK